MASKRPFLAQQGRVGLLLKESRRAPSVCPFCSLAAPTRPEPRRRRTAIAQRYQSNLATPSDHRAKLQQCLRELEKRFPTLVNISRVQLALQGLHQSPGEEVVRVAVFGLASESDDGKTARSVLRALLADPLSDEQEWEEKLDNYDPAQPLIVRVAPRQPNDNALTFAKDAVPPELHISSPALNNLNLEFLLMEIDAPAYPNDNTTIQSAEETFLVPAVEIPTGEGRFTPITTPVHQALIVADGFTGAIKLSALPLEAQESVLTAVNMKGVSKEQLAATFEVIDVTLAGEAVRLFRQGPQHGMEYERLWSASKLPSLVSWLRSNNTPEENSTKPVVRKLVASILQNTLADIQLEESRNLSKGLDMAVSPAAVQSLNRGLAEWAQQAHTELQTELDAAFVGKRWRKLGWWKLFWRVDDVGMLTSEMLSQRFLPTAEQELVYLTGRVAELGGGSPRYAQPVSSEEGHGKVPLLRKSGADELAIIPPAKISAGLPKWPGHITFTRRYLQNETVPALQSLAQQLVVQSLGLSSMTTALAALLYVSSFASTLYEAGAVAALGIVYSLNRLQKKWETARTFWEGETREEGRKAVRAAEASVAEVLARGQSVRTPKEAEERAEELQRARALVAEAEDALARMK